MNERVALVTGASSGIGKVTALRLAAQGYYVFGAARHTDPIEAVKVAGLESLELDVTSDDSIKAALETVMAHSGRLDVLVNNAGFGAYGTVEEMSIDDARRQFDVNVFGLASLTQHVLPTMRKQRSGYIVNVSSVAGRMGMPMMGWYSASKHALEAYSDALRLEVKPFGIKVVVIQPGYVKTNFQDNAAQHSEGTEQLDAYRGLNTSFRDFQRGNNETGADPYAVASVIEKAITSDNPSARYAAPFSAKGYLLGKRVLGDRIMDTFMARALKWR